MLAGPVKLVSFAGLVILTVGAPFKAITENLTSLDVVKAPLLSVAFAVIV